MSSLSEPLRYGVRTVCGVVQTFSLLPSNCTSYAAAPATGSHEIFRALAGTWTPDSAAKSSTVTLSGRAITRSPAPVPSGPIQRRVKLRTLE